MKIAIQKSGKDFSERWIRYCEQNNIHFKIVDVYQSDIIDQVRDCDAFMWHHNQGDYRDCLFAKQLLYSLQKKGLKVFPDYDTTWHFDDKVGQKYLLESIGAPLVPSYVFYTKKDAIDWVNSASFPKVFKLRGGAGSANVMFVKDKYDARKLINTAFGRGFKQYNAVNSLKERWRKYKLGKANATYVVKGLFRLFIRPVLSKMRAPEKGYVYFQDYIPNNFYDIRVCVVGNRAFAIKRLVREHDFRASGSGSIIYEKTQIDERCIQIAFDVNCRLNAQSVGFDFVFDIHNNPLIVEISYGYVPSGYDECEGFWTNDMQWHEGKGFDFCGWMVENLIK
jgi:glutathione synthase/RimK-type ligase-like ATP-grasp enzyme